MEGFLSVCYIYETSISGGNEVKYQQNVNAINLQVSIPSEQLMQVAGYSIQSHLIVFVWNKNEFLQKWKESVITYIKQETK